MITFIVHRGRDGNYYWRGVSANGKVVADGGEGYSTRQNARRAVRRFVQAVQRGNYTTQSR